MIHTRNPGIESSHWNGSEILWIGRTDSNGNHKETLEVRCPLTLAPYTYLDVK